MFTTAVERTSASISAFGLAMPVMTTIGVPSLCGGNGVGGFILYEKNDLQIYCTVLTHENEILP